jgi:hypothetical protein
LYAPSAGPLSQIGPIDRIVKQCALRAFGRHRNLRNGWCWSSTSARGSICGLPILRLLSLLIFPVGAILSLLDARATCLASGPGSMSSRIGSAVVTVSYLILLRVALVFRLIGVGAAF